MAERNPAESVRLETIVVGIDFSEEARSAAHWVARHLADGAELILVHTVELPTMPAFLTGLTPTGELVDTARAGAEHRLNELARSLESERVRTVVHVGRPSEVIATVARENGADLVVVGEHGRGRGLSGVLGTTAERVVRIAASPVLIARGLPDGPPKNILLPVDESETSNQVLAWGRYLTEHFSAGVQAVYALSPLLYSRVRAVSSATRERNLQDSMRENARAWLQQRLEGVGLSGERVTADVVVGEPSYEIIAAAQRYDTDLIVMGIRGAGALTPVLVGRVTRAVLRGAAEPVLIIKE